MHENKYDPEVTTHSLKDVAPVVGVAIRIDVWLAGDSEIHAEGGMKGDGQPEYEYFDQDECGKGVNEIHFMLKGFYSGMPALRQMGTTEPRTPHNRGVGRQVRQEERPDRDEAAQRMESPKKKVMSIQKPFICVAAHDQSTLF